MTPAVIAKRLQVLEARLAPSRRAGRPDDDVLAWVKWTTNAELDQLENIYRVAADAGRELTEVEQLCVVEIRAAALRREMTGEQPECAYSARPGEPPLPVLPVER